jgi:hypothetical protein
MAIEKKNDTIGNAIDNGTGGFNTAWDYKNQYVSGLNQDSLERFSQYSATPDTTMLFAGPARYTGLTSPTAELTPIGLTDGIALQSSPQLQRMYEIGSNRAYFTRGKTMSSVSFSRVLADQASILAALTKNTYRPRQNTAGPGSPSAIPNPQVAMNIDSEYFATPFGLMLMFKTRGGPSSNGATDITTITSSTVNDTSGKVLACVYLEYCMFSNYSFQIANQSPVIMEGLGIEFDRIIPIQVDPI